jgi:hypothetical protein
LSHDRSARHGEQGFRSEEWRVVHAGRIAQRHPLAILAFLAAAPSATASREKLLGLLWLL